MALLKKNPFADFITLQERMSQLFDEAANKRSSCYGTSKGAWSPAVDIYETGEQILLSVELPGVDNNDVDVEVDGNVLNLRGFRRFSTSLTEENYLRMERFYGAFQRLFNLPAAVDKDGIKATFKDGVLRIVLPKIEKDGAKRIKVESS